MWAKVSVAVYSGAGESVAPINYPPFSEIPRTRSPQQDAGVHYVSATGQRVPNEGEQKIRGRLEDDSSASMTYQLCEVSKPLNVAYRVCEKNNRIVLDLEEGKSHIENKVTGHKTLLHWRKRVPMLDMWIPRKAIKADSPFRRQH